jgi:DNA-binding response OmpR family regulator
MSKIMSDKKAKPRRGSDGDSEGPGPETTVAHVPRILIVEDAVELVELLRATIERMHMLVFTETHGMRALERYNDIHPDLVLLDIALPDMTGWKVLDAMKESKAIFRRPRIIVMTAYGDPANRLMGKLQGIDKYLTKPFTTTEVVSLIREVLAGESSASPEANKLDESAEKSE